MPRIPIAIVGIGNCASSLVQGIFHYRAGGGAGGLMHEEIGGYGVGDIEVVAAFDIDSRKVGRRLNDAIFALPNNTAEFARPPAGDGVEVRMGPVLDGVSEHMLRYPLEQRFDVSGAPPCDVAGVLRESGARLLVNFLPVGSQAASEFYARACLEAGVGLVNCIPVFIASDAKWANAFSERGLPVIGDDIKAQLGATITHRTLARLFAQRGMRVRRTYQLNTGGNTDFLNMLNRDRLSSKKVSKTEAVQSELGVPLDAADIHIGPSDFVAWQKDNKVCFLRIEATGFGGVPMNLEMRLSVEDSPNSAAVVVDAIRLGQIALARKMSGPIEAACAWCMKHPPVQLSDAEALAAVDRFIDS